MLNAKTPRTPRSEERKRMRVSIKCISLSVFPWLLGVLAFISSFSCAHAEINVVVDRNDNAEASAQFKFKHVPSPSANDVGMGATVSLVDGTRDRNSAELS